MRSISLVAKHNKLEWSKPDGLMPDPASLEQLAIETPAMVPTMCASDYGATTNTLREKGFTWAEVHEWYKIQGVTAFGWQAIRGGWYRWARRNKSSC